MASTSALSPLQAIKEDCKKPEVVEKLSLGISKAEHVWWQDALMGNLVGREQFPTDQLSWDKTWKLFSMAVINQDKTSVRNDLGNFIMEMAVRTTRIPMRPSHALLLKPNGGPNQPDFSVEVGFNLDAVLQLATAATTAPSDPYRDFIEKPTEPHTGLANLESVIAPLGDQLKCAFIGFYMLYLSRIALKTPDHVHRQFGSNFWKNFNSLYNTALQGGSGCLFTTETLTAIAPQFRIPLPSAITYWYTIVCSYVYREESYDAQDREQVKGVLVASTVQQLILRDMPLLMIAAQTMAVTRQPLIVIIGATALSRTLPSLLAANDILLVYEYQGADKQALRSKYGPLPGGEVVVGKQRLWQFARFFMPSTMMAVIRRESGDAIRQLQVLHDQVCDKGLTRKPKISAGYEAVEHTLDDAILTEIADDFIEKYVTAENDMDNVGDLAAEVLARHPKDEKKAKKAPAATAPAQININDIFQ